MEPKSHHTSITKLEVFEASDFQSMCRLEMDGITSGVLHVFDGKQQATIRVCLSTLVCLRHIVNAWHAEEFAERKKTD